MKILRTLSAAIVLFATLIAAEEKAQAQLSVRFIGNAAFRITDGKTVLLSDFPYTSGAFDYMKYDPAEVKEEPEALCLITHAHADHWNPELFAKMHAALIGPPALMKSQKASGDIEFASKMSFRDLEIEAFPTPHAGEHYSYLVNWHGKRLFFSGDTEDPWLLVATRNLDVAFVTPWLLARLQDQGKKVDAKKIIVYHHGTREQVVPYQDRIVPNQGDTFTIP